MRQKAGILLIRFPVFQVDILMRDIPVATDNEFAPFAANRLQVQFEGCQKAILGLLTMFAG